MIFDAHVHLMRFGPTPGSVDESELSLLLRRMDLCGVDRAMLLGAVAVGGYDPSPEQIRDCNDQTMAVVTRLPKRFDGLCYLNPSHSAAFIDEEVGRCIAYGPMRGIKLWVAVNVRDERLDAVMEHAIHLDVPILIHAWYKTTNAAPNESDPSDIRHLARRHPQARIIMAHLTGCGVRGVLDIADLANVSVDTSGGQPVAGLVEYAVRVLGAQRVIYGSDWPVRDFATQLGKLNVPAITSAERAMITSQNLQQLLQRRRTCLST